MTLEWVTSWWNLIFILPFGLGLMYLGLYTLSGWTFGEADGDFSMDHDVDAHLGVDGHIEIDQDVSHDLHTDIDADADADTDTDSDNGSGETHASALLTVLNWIGLGRVPMSLVLMILMLCWGGVGFLVIQLTRGLALTQAVTIAIAAAALSSTCVTHVVASILGPLLYSNKNMPRRRHELLGSRGEAMYPIDTTFGMVHGRDEHGEIFQAACRIEEGQPLVAKGAAVQLVAYAAKDRMFYVVPVDSSTTPRPVRTPG